MYFLDYYKINFELDGFLIYTPKVFDLIDCIVRLYEK